MPKTVLRFVTKLTDDTSVVNLQTCTAHFMNIWCAEDMHSLLTFNTHMTRLAEQETKTGKVANTEHQRYI